MNVNAKREDLQFQNEYQVFSDDFNEILNLDDSQNSLKPRVVKNFSEESIQETEQLLEYSGEFTDSSSAGSSELVSGNIAYSRKKSKSDGSYMATNMNHRNHSKSEVVIPSKLRDHVDVSEVIGVRTFLDPAPPENVEEAEEAKDNVAILLPSEIAPLHIEVENEISSTESREDSGTKRGKGRERAQTITSDDDDYVTTPNIRKKIGMFLRKHFPKNNREASSEIIPQDSHSEYALKGIISGILVNPQTSSSPDSNESLNARKKSKQNRDGSVGLRDLIINKELGKENNSADAIQSPMSPLFVGEEPTQSSMESLSLYQSSDDEVNNKFNPLEGDAGATSSTGIRFPTELRSPVFGPVETGRPSSIHTHISLKDVEQHRKESKEVKNRGGRSASTSFKFGSSSMSRSGSDSSLAEKYGKVETVVGKGAHATVRLVHKREKDAKWFAVKEFRKKKKDESEKEYVKKVVAEFCISSALHHENVVETIDLLKDQVKLINKHGKWCVVMEYCAGGDLLHKMMNSEFSDIYEKLCYFKQIICGLEYIHANGVVHRDLKPENILLEESHRIIKITDFGVSTVFRAQWEHEIRLVHGKCGSAPYMPPEEWVEGAEYLPTKVDLWATGMIFYSMLTKGLLWSCSKESDCRYAGYLKKREIGYPPIEVLEKDHKELLYTLLDPNPTGRIEASEILQLKWVEEIRMCLQSDTTKNKHHEHL